MKRLTFLVYRSIGLRLVDEAGFNFRPVFNKKRVLMSRYADFQFFDVAGEVRHELVHIIRYENGRYNKIKRSKSYLPTEEGLASEAPGDERARNR